MDNLGACPQARTPWAFGALARAWGQPEAELENNQIQKINRLIGSDDSSTYIVKTNGGARLPIERSAHGFSR